MAKATTHAFNIFAISACVLIHSIVVANDEEQLALEQAPEGYLSSLLEMCTSYIVSDEEQVINLQGQLLSCINQELREGYYFPISHLPQELIDVSAEDNKSIEAM